jgi:hypothetical protein
MSAMAEMFRWFTGNASLSELPELYPMQINAAEWVKGDVVHIFQKILTDVAERMEGIPEKKQKVLWDNCLKSEASFGLITFLARAMQEKADLFLVLDGPDKDVIRKAKPEEQKQIEADYKEKASSELGIFVSFKEYKKSDFLNAYSMLELCTIEALNKQMNLAKAVQLKMDSMRKSTGATDVSVIESQAKTVVESLSKGKPVLLDAKDTVDLLEPKIDPVKEAINFMNQKKAYYLGLPASYIMGELSGGLNADGTADAKATERGLKNYFFSVMKPVSEALFGGTMEYKSENFDMIDTSLNVLRTMEMTSEDFLPLEMKRAIIAKAFDIDLAELEKLAPDERTPKPEPQVPGQPAPKPGAPAPKPKADA